MSVPPNEPSDSNSDDAEFDLAPADVPVVPQVLTHQDPTVQLKAMRERVYATMLKRHTIDAQLAWALILGGLSILLVAGAIFSIVMYFVTAITFEEPSSAKFFFLLYLLALIPLFVWQVRRTRSGFFTLAQPDVDLTRDPDNIGEYLINRSRANANAVIDGFLWAPRAIIAGIRALRGVREAGLDIVLPEAADLLTLMLSLDGGVKIKDLAPPGEDPMQLMPTLKWLDAHDYIGTSTRGDRVWVSTFAKKRLAADHGAAFAPKITPAARR